MAKLAREALVHYIDTAWHASFSAVSTSSAVAWEVVGTDIEDMSVELNPDVETKKNILGQTRAKDNGYEPTMSADPFYADPDSKLYEKLRDIALERKKGADCKTLMLELIVEDTEAETFTAYVREVLVKPTSYGGGTDGVNIPFTVTEDGSSTKGTVTAASIKAGAPVFTAAA